MVASVFIILIIIQFITIFSLLAADNKPGLGDLLCMSYTGEDGRATRFRLMNQLQSHWRRLAIALKFQHSDITVMECKDDPVYHLLSEWLRGANQDRDSRPVTWATLITALRDANVQEEANMLENHFVPTKSAPVAISRRSGELSILKVVEIYLKCH